MVKILEKYKNKINLSDVINIRGLRLFPVILDTKSQDNNLEMMEGLIKKDQLEISEIGDDGIVSKINIFNKGPSDLFIIDGEVIIGAKQNRIAHRSAILPCFSENIFPVHCVERGRWEFRGRREFSEGKFSAGPKMRSEKNIQSKFSEHSAQSAVWERVDNLSLEMDMKSDTDDMESLLEKSNFKPKEIEIEKIENSNCNGYLVFGAGRPFIEIFSDKRACISHTKKSISSWLADYDNMFHSNDNISKQSEMDDINKFIKDKFYPKVIDSLWKKEKPIGKEIAYESLDETGKAIFLDDQLVHCYYYF